MIVCPACRAENPDGTKICVKCGAELPKAAGAAPKAKTAAEPVKKFGMKDIGQDLVDALWLFFILVLIAFFFVMEAGHWQWPLSFTETEEAILIPAPVKTLAKNVKHLTSAKAPMKVAKEPKAMGEKPAVYFGNAETFYKKSQKQYDAKHYQASYNSLKQTLEIDPTFAKAYFALGYLYSRFDMDDAAVRMYEMSLRFDPKHPDSYNNLAMMYYHAGNYDDALELFQKAVELNGQNADYMYNLGSVYLDKDQPDAALQAFQTAASNRPDDAAIYTDMAVAYEKLGRKQEAVDAWQKVIQFSKSSDLLKNAKSHLEVLQPRS